MAKQQATKKQLARLKVGDYIEVCWVDATEFRDTTLDKLKADDPVSWRECGWVVAVGKKEVRYCYSTNTLGETNGHSLPLGWILKLRILR